MYIHPYLVILVQHDASYMFDPSCRWRQIQVYYILYVLLVSVMTIMLMSYSMANCPCLKAIWFQSKCPRQNARLYNISEDTNEAHLNYSTQLICHDIHIIKHIIILWDRLCLWVESADGTSPCQVHDLPLTSVLSVHLMMAQPTAACARGSLQANTYTIF